jgi:DNA-binding LytR/AlgR family response regulator
MKVLIVEDEFLAAERLQNLLFDIDPSIEVVGKLDSVEDAVVFFSSRAKIDLLLLDIQLADGKSFEIFDKVNVDVPVIFTTAYDQYALQAFQFLSIDYLLKPVQPESLGAALRKLRKVIGSSTFSGEEINVLRQLIAGQKKTYKERFVIKVGNKLQFRSAKDVAYFYAEGKIVYLVTRNDNRKYIIDHTLEELEGALDPSVFFRISRKYIINVESLSEVKPQMSGRLEIKMMQQGEQELSVSRERANEFKVWLNR